MTVSHAKTAEPIKMLFGRQTFAVRMEIHIGAIWRMLVNDKNGSNVACRYY